jgi:hypothetical protein
VVDAQKRLQIDSKQTAKIPNFIEIFYKLVIKGVSNVTEKLQIANARFSTVHSGLEMVLIAFILTQIKFSR